MKCRPQKWMKRAFLALVASMGCGWSNVPLPEKEAVTGEEKKPRFVTIAAASDLRFVFPEMIKAFQKGNPDIHVEATYGSSGNFFAQLSQKAPFDLYFSADVDYPRKLLEAGLAVPGSERIYAIGRIVAWVRKDSPMDVEKLGIQALLDPSVRKIAIANPKHAPYGRAAAATIEHFGLTDQLKEKLVLGENIAQTAQFVESGAAQVGILALSLACAPTYREQGRYWVIPMDSYPRMQQGCVLLEWAKDREAAERLKDFVTGPAGREILERYGFYLPGE